MMENKVKKKCRCCFVCLTSTSKESITLHGFPRNALLRSKWLEAFHLTEADYNPSRKICSKHFDVDSFILNSNRLKSGAIPHPCDDLVEILIDPVAKKEKKTEQPKSNYEYDYIGIPIDEFTLQNHDNTTKFKVLHKQEQLQLDSVDTPVLNKISSKCSEITKAKRIAYVGDIKPTDLTTLSKAVEYFEMAKNTLHKKDKKIKVLNQRVLRLKKRLNTLEKIVKQYKTFNSCKTLLNISNKAHVLDT